MRIPLEPPIFRSVAEQQMQRAVNAMPLAGYEGASPSASTMHPTRRKRRTVLVRQRAGRTSPWMLQFFADVVEQ